TFVRAPGSWFRGAFYVARHCDKTRLVKCQPMFTFILLNMKKKARFKSPLRCITGTIVLLLFLQVCRAQEAPKKIAVKILRDTTTAPVPHLTLSIESGFKNELMRIRQGTKTIFYGPV